MTAHIESSKDDIAKVVLMPGDPLRAKYIAEHFLTDYKLVNSVRNMFAYTGYYKDFLLLHLICRNQHWELLSPSYSYQFGI